MSFISGVGVGLGVSALFGTNGGRNRALLRDKVVHYGHETSDFVTKASRDLANRSKGLLHPKRDGENTKLDILQSNWAPATKLLVGTAALGVGIYSLVSLAKQPEAIKSLLGAIRDVLGEKDTSSVATASSTAEYGTYLTEGDFGEIPSDQASASVASPSTMPSGLGVSRNTGAGTAENQASG
jgi:hypothetical protein